ncbi:uncharacterized protein [Anabrus simplex]|uniref:uncharacterized protein n=1 Tax=Anabrus simplex TaxID=316456 RepID=UPI0035A3A89F
MTSKLQGSQVIIFDKVDGSFYRNINEEIVKYQPYIDGIYNYYDADMNIEADRQCVEVIHILPLNHVLMYLDPHWKEHLVEISSKVHQLVLEMRTSSGKTNTFRRGQFVGFCSSEARFEGETLIMMSYLRAEVLSVIGDQAMLWSMDIGLLTYCPVEKLCLIEDKTLLSRESLVSLAALKGPICEYDEDFLELALRLLKDLLKPSAQQGKHMFLSDTGEDILILMEHPNNQIRIHILDIILHLANHCQEVRFFLEKQKFDLNLAGKLERYVHSYGSDLCPTRALLKIEMIIIVKILSTLFEDKVDLQNWPGKEQTVTALKILIEETDVQPTYIFRNCLRQLIGKATANSQDNNRGEYGGVCMKGPHRQGFSRQWTRKQDSNGLQFRKNESSKGGDTRIGDMKTSKEMYRSNNNANGKDSHCLDHCESPILFEKAESDKKSKNGYYQSYDDSLKTFMESGTKAVEEEKKSLSGQVDYLIRGSTVDVKSDQTHHLMEEKEVHDLQEMKLAQVLCGLLNNNVESYMYFGISQDSVVEGMLLTRDNKDVFRNGVDRTMSKSLLPEVQLSAYDIIFTPVIRPGDKVIALAKKALYVIEIRVRPLRHMVYALHQCRKCYVRRDADTLESTITQKKNYMIEMEEKALDDATNSIREISQGYLAILASFIDKYLSKGNDSNTENTE